MSTVNETTAAFTEAEVEVVARALHTDDTPVLCDWPCAAKADLYRQYASSALTAVAPLIAARVVEQVALAIEAEALATIARGKQYEHHGMVTSASVARIKDEFLRDAATIARSLAPKVGA